MLAEACCPELRDETILMRIAHLCLNRHENKLSASRESMVFILDCLRVGRLTGQRPADAKYSVDHVTGAQYKNKVALIHELFKKQHLVEFIFYEAALVHPDLPKIAGMYRTPAAIMKHFSASGEGGLVDKFRQGDQAAASLKFEGTFSTQVADHRDQEKHDSKAKALIDFLWPVWAGHLDDEFKTMCEGDAAGAAAGAKPFLWHTFLEQTSLHGIGQKYRAFVTACQGGPTDPGLPPPPLPGQSELAEEDKEDLQKVQALLMKLRRDKVRFTALPEVGGASGAEYSRAQLDKVWGELFNGHRFARKKEDVRALVLSAEVFPPNVVKQATTAGLAEAVAVDTKRMQAVIDFILAKRTKEDLILIFDGRSRGARRLMGEYEDKLAAGGAHRQPEIWVVYSTPEKSDDPRVPRKQTSFASNNREVVYSALPSRYSTKVISRAEFNACGESSSASTSYTGVPMRRMCELPRMDEATKSSILGVPAAGVVAMGGVQSDIDDRGHPFAHSEVKPLNLLQRIFEHHQVTHIVDFAAGSGAMAIAAAGAMAYDGIAVNAVHRDWLDSTLDQCVMAMAGQDQDFTKKLGVNDDEVVAKVSKYFGGTLMEARRILAPLDEDKVPGRRPSGGPPSESELDSESGSEGY